MMRPGNTTNEYGKVMLQAIRYDTSNGQKRKGSLISDVRSLSYGYKKSRPAKDGFLKTALANDYNISMAPAAVRPRSS